MVMIILLCEGVRILFLAIEIGKVRKADIEDQQESKLNL
jgi:hypothetical protein